MKKSDWHTNRYTPEEERLMRAHYWKGARHVHDNHIPRKSVQQIRVKASYMGLKVDKEVRSKLLAESSSKGAVIYLENRGLKSMSADPVAQEAIRKYYPTEGARVMKRKELEGFTEVQVKGYAQRNKISCDRRIAYPGKEHKPRKVEKVPVTETVAIMKGRALPYWGILT